MSAFSGWCLREGGNALIKNVKHEGTAEMLMEMSAELAIALLLPLQLEILHKPFHSKFLN
jgi:hypothetical protein